MKLCPLKRTDCNPCDAQLISSRIREGEGRIVQCPRCHLVMQDLDWSAERLVDYYNDEYQRTNSLVTGQL